MKIACIAGARPNFMKIAPILEAMKPYPNLDSLLGHTGQHYDYQMSGVFFKELEIPEPDIHLGVCSVSHAVQTAKIMMAFEETALEHQPDLVLVVGDVNSTLACALVAAKLHIPVAHVEAGIRSFDMTMPEEVNRVVTDDISDYLLPPSNFGRENLIKEGISEDKIFVVGDTMIDTLFKFRERAEQTPILTELGLKAKSYALMTLHRPANVDIKENLIAILDAIEEHPIAFPDKRAGKAARVYSEIERLAGDDPRRMVVHFLVTKDLDAERLEFFRVPRGTYTWEVKTAFETRFAGVLYCTV